MRSADSHLTPQELESLLFPAADSNVTANRDATREAQQHLDGCDVCQGMAKRYANADAILRSLVPKARLRNKSSAQPPEGRGPGHDCPPEETWLRLAAGLLDDAAASLYLAHAAQCDWCGKLLRESMEDLAQDVTTEELDAIAKLESASPGWQREMGAKLAAESGQGAGVAATATARKPAAETKQKGRFGWWPRVAFAVASLVVVAAAVSLVWQKTGVLLAKRLLARTYAVQRTTELRMPGAAYGPIRVERGNGRRDFPASFDVAEWIIKTESPKHPEDPEWLQAQARVDLLEWDYDGAIKKLDAALLSRPDDPALLVDKAMALFERAEKRGKPPSVDYGEAAEDLNLALKRNADDPVALFNLAIIHEKLSLPHEAIEDCDHYLRLYPSGPWADETRKRRKRLESLVKIHADALSQPLADPTAFVRLAADPKGVAQLEERIEDYQDKAIEEWLPSAFSRERVTTNRAKVPDALKALGKLLATHHHDRWLDDLLAGASDSPAFASALHLLRNAVIESGAGHASSAYKTAEKANRLFTVARNQAGSARAEEEEIHALRNSQNGDICLSEGKSLTKKLEDRGYSWIQDQLDIDMSSCFLMAGEFDRARAYALIAGENSKNRGYPTLYSRSVGMVAAVETDEGNLLEAWAKDQYGLSEYWRNPFSPARRAQQFYDDLTYSAEDANELSLALAFAQESVRMISLAGDQKLEALSRQHLAKIAFRDGNTALAAGELAKSSDLLASLPPSEELHADRLYAQIGLAEVEMQAGNLTQADKRLTPLLGEADKIASFTIPRAFYKAYGELLERQGNISLAETAYRRAIEAADSNLEKLESPSKRYFWTQENSGLYRSLVQLELKRGDKSTALAVWEWYQSALVARSSLPARSLTSFLARDSLGLLVSSLRNQTVVSYSLLPAGLEIWVFDERGTQAKLVSLDPAYVTKLASSFSEMCGDPKSDLSRLRAKGRELYDVLLGPVEAQLSPGRVIVIEPDEFIGDLSFPALVTRDGRYLGEVYNSVLSPGIVYEQQLRPAGLLSGGAHSLVIASTASFVGPDISLDPATDVVEEAEAVAGLFSNAKPLVDQVATVEDVETALPEAESIHFVGHAISTADHEGLVMLAKRGGSETTLWGADAVQPRFFSHAKLAVLSACSTGKSYRGRREVHGALVRSLLLAGVPTVVGSRWNVNSRVTAHFMDLFYKGLMSGQSVSISIQAAESELRRQPETQHPYYWAAFAVFGRA